MSNIQKLLYYANICDYVRIGLYFASFNYLYEFKQTKQDEQLKMVFYTFSAGFILDEIDGRIARFFNQVSVFGSVLDYIIDVWSVTTFMLMIALLKSNAMFMYIIYKTTMLTFCLMFHFSASSHDQLHTHIKQNSVGRFTYYYYKYLNYRRLLIYNDFWFLPLLILSDSSLIYPSIILASIRDIVLLDILKDDLLKLLNK